MTPSSRVLSVLWCGLGGFAIADLHAQEADCSDMVYAGTAIFGGLDTDILKALAVGTDGSLVVVGDFTGTVDFDPGSGMEMHTSNGSEDVFVLKLDSDRSFLWARTFGGVLPERTLGLSVGPDGSVAVAGWFHGTVDFDPTEGVDEHTTNGEADAFIIKLGSDGSYAWTRTVGGGASDFGLGAAVASDGAVLFSGFFESTVDFDPSEEGVDQHSSEGNEDAFVTKLTAEGDYQWSRTFGGESFETAQNLALGPNDIVVLSGGFLSEVVDFDPTDGVDLHDSNGFLDGYVTELDSDGGYHWTATIGGSGADAASRVVVGEAGDVFISGTIDEGSVIDMDPTDGIDERVSNGELDVFITKLTADGGYGWTWTAGGQDSDAPGGLAVDASGNILVSGQFGEFNSEDGYAVDFDQTGEGDVRVSNGESDAFLTMLHADGSYGWTRTLGGEGSDDAEDIAVDDQGRLWVGGFFTGPVDFDPDGAGDVRDSLGETDLFVTSYLCTDELPCDGDANGDGLVDPLDSGFVLARFGCDVGAGDPDCDIADMNGDGLVDPLDVGFILARFGTCE